MSSMDGFGAIAAVAIIGTVIMVIIGIALYVFVSFALYKLAQKRGIEMAWLAWIPVAQMYVLGQMVKTLKISTFEIPSLEIVLPVAMLANMLLGAIPVLGWLINIAFLVLFFFTLNKLYKQYVPEKATMYTVLSILGIPIPFFFLKFSKTDPVSLD